MQKILAITWLTWKAAVRFRLFFVIAALLVLAVVGLPLVVKDDGTARGFTQIILTYTLSAITALLGFSTLWLACGTLARDIEECQMQVVVTKPVARWQVWVGKWLGLVSLNAVLLALSGGCVLGVLEWRATKLPPVEQKTLREQVLVARGSAKEASHDTEIYTTAAQVLQERKKADPELASSANLDEVEKQIVAQVKAGFESVPPGYVKEWQVDLGRARDFLSGKPLQLRVKFNTPIQGSSTVCMAAWQVGDSEATNYWQSEPMSLAADTFHEFQIPPDLYNAKGVLTISVLNLSSTPMVFSLDDGLEVLYPESSFILSFIRGLGIIFCWLAVMGALGLMAASFLTFPVAAFFSLSLLVMALSSGTLSDAIDAGTITGVNGETGQAGHSAADYVLLPAFKGLLEVIQLVQNFSPVDALSSGRDITWGELGRAFLQIVLGVGGFFAVVGIICFSRRELATAQGTQ